MSRGIATAVAPDGGLTDVQAGLLDAITEALTGVAVDHRSLDPLGPDELAAALGDRSAEYRQRVVHHMVLAELVLRPLPADVARRVARYAEALDVDDRFVRVARRYAQGAYGLAWVDLRRSGFVEHWASMGQQQFHGGVELEDPFDRPVEDPALYEEWAAFEDLPPGSLGRSVWEMYVGRGFILPGMQGGASAYLAQHDFVHVLADYGTNLKGELEVFALISRADPDPKGFAWLATLVGLFETGYVATTGFFERNIKERNLEAPGMHVRLADALRRGREVASEVGRDLLDVDYHDLVALGLDEVRLRLGFPVKAAEAVAAGSPSVFDREGLSPIQQSYVDARAAAGQRGGP